MAQPFSDRVINKWVAKLSPKLVHISFGICGDRHLAEEIVQEAWVRLWKSPPDAGEPAILSWMKTTVTNLSISKIRRKRRTLTLIDESGSARDVRAERPGGVLERRESVSRIAAALEKLDPDKRAMIMLCVNEGMSYKAIAEHLGVPTGTVMSRLNRARLALIDVLQDCDPSDRPSDFDINSYFDEPRRAARR